MRRKIGVALGAGAARGLAQIGILEGLTSLGIVPDIVCGTSIGALVGAAFVTGKLSALKNRMENFSRLDVTSMLDVRLATGGLIEGRRVESFLDELGISGSIETLESHYAAVATDLATGREVWLRKGPIGHAVRASIGIPGVFSPARNDSGNGWLIDGGLVNPVPVSLARALGADIVIAVEMHSELVGRRFKEFDDQITAATVPALPEETPHWLKETVGPVLQRVLQAGADYPSYFDVLANSLNIMQDRIARARLAGDPPEVLLHARVGNLNWLDFHRAKEAITEGLACVQASEPTIRRVCQSTISKL